MQKSRKIFSFTYVQQLGLFIQSVCSFYFQSRQSGFNCLLQWENESRGSRSML